VHRVIREWRGSEGELTVARRGVEPGEQLDKSGHIFVAMNRKSLPGKQPNAGPIPTDRC
jgi:hypothetical protein